MAYLGTNEPLYQSEDGYAVSLSAHQPMRLKWTGEAVEGEVGHVARRFCRWLANRFVSSRFKGTGIIHNTAPRSKFAATRSTLGSARRYKPAP